MILKILLIGFFCAWTIWGAGGTDQKKVAPNPDMLPDKTAQELPEVERVSEYRQLWKKRTRGNNVALGKKVSFSLTPEYRLTVKGQSDHTDLTDGKISSLKHDVIWFDAKAVGWWIYSGVYNGVNLLVDLEEEKNLDRLVIRVLGGRAQVPLAFPRGFEVYVSLDGQKFHRTSAKYGVSDGEEDLGKLGNSYFLEENGTAFVYPMEMEIKARARYVGLRLTGATDSIFCDELALMEAEEKDSNFDAAYKKDPEEFPMQGVLIAPRFNELVVSRNALTPNHFVMKEMRPAKHRSDQVILQIKLPVGVEIVEPQPIRVTHSAIGTEVEIHPGYYASRTEAIYFKVLPEYQDGGQAVFKSSAPGCEPYTVTVPIQIIELPEFEQYEKLNISVWGGKPFPGFWEMLKKCGFTAVTSFPYRWRTPEAVEKGQSHLLKARQEGFLINMIGVFGYQKMHGLELSPDKQQEYRSILPDGMISQRACPSYRGELYDQALKNYGKRIKDSLWPEVIFNDIEMWSSCIREAQQCGRCQEKQEKLGVSMDAFLEICGTEQARDIHQEVIKAYAGKELPQVGYYNVIPGRSYHDVFSFEKLYPIYTQYAQPVCYVAGDVIEVRKRVIAAREQMRENRVLPWLTTGTYGEFNPRKVEFQVLETLMNGGCGFVYFFFSDFDTPWDMYYQARILSILRPYENILTEGEVLYSLPASNPVQFLSALQLDKVLLLSAGNYEGGAEKQTITLPPGKVKLLRDLRNNQSFNLDNSQLTFDVPKWDYRLFKVEFE